MSDLFKLLMDIEYMHLNVGSYCKVGFHGTLGRVFQPQYSWYFGHGNFMVWGPSLCIIWYLAASLAFYPLDAGSTTPAQLQQTKASPDIVKCLLVEKHCSKIKVYGKNHIDSKNTLEEPIKSLIKYESFIPSKIFIEGLWCAMCYSYC